MMSKESKINEGLALLNEKNNYQPLTILMGDFNTNLLHVFTSTHAQNFMLSLQSLNLTPTIDKPTRVHNNSYSLIDNIFINSLEYSICSGNIVSDLTDHFSQFCILNFSTNRDLCDQSKCKRLGRYKQSFRSQT